MQFSRIILAILPVSVYALEPPHGSPTDKATDAIGLENGFTPKPTQSPALPALGYEPHANLFARDQPIFTCGFYDGDSSYPNTCGPTSGCSFATSPYYYFGCCQFTGSVSDNQWYGTYGDDCFAISTCTEYASHSYTNAGASISGDAVLCGSVVPDCATTYLYDVPGYEGVYSHFDCVSSDYSGDVYDLEWSTTTDTTTGFGSSATSVVSASGVSTTVQPLTHTVVSVSVVQITVSGQAETTSTSTTTTTSSSSSVSAQSASSTTSSSTTGGAEVLLPTGIGLAVVAGIAAML